MIYGLGLTVRRFAQERVTQYTTTTNSGTLANIHFVSGHRLKLSSIGSSYRDYWDHGGIFSSISQAAPSSVL